MKLLIRGTCHSAEAPVTRLSRRTHCDTGGDSRYAERLAVRGAADPFMPRAITALFACAGARMMSALHGANRRTSDRSEQALAFLRMGSTPRTFLRTRSTVRALVPARCSTGPREQSPVPPQRGGVMFSELNEIAARRLSSGKLVSASITHARHEQRRARAFIPTAGFECLE